MSKKYLVVVLVLLILVLVGGGYYWKTTTQKLATGVDGNIPRSVLPVVNTAAANPMESVQGANPYDKTNPYSNIKVNPFE